MNHRRRRLVPVVLALSVALSGCGTNEVPGSDESAMEGAQTASRTSSASSEEEHVERCAALLADYGPDAELVAAAPGSGNYASVCWIDGHVPKAPPRPEDGSVLPSFDRVVVGVLEDGSTRLIRAGYRSALTPPS